MRNCIPHNEDTNNRITGQQLKVVDNDETANDDESRNDKNSLRRQNHYFQRK